MSSNTASGMPAGENGPRRAPGEAIERISDAFLALDREWRYTYVNAQAGWLFGRRPEDLVGRHIWTEFPESVGREFCLAYEKAMREQQPVFLEEYYPPLDRWFENRIYPSSEGLTVYLHDITGRKKDEALLNGQKEVLEMIAAGAPLEATLVALVRVMEAQSPEMLGTILLLDEDGLHLRHGAAPSAPAAYARAIDGGAVGPRSGSCGTAAFRREPVIVEDIAADPLWEDYRALALAHGLRACWSTPILDASRRVLGTFAIYYRQPGRPMAQHRRLIEIATHIAAIAIGHERAQAALRLSESRHRALFEYAPDGILMADSQGRYLDANASVCRMLGYAREELIGLHAPDIVVPAEVPHIGPALHAIKAKGGYHREWQFRRKDGSVFAAEVIATTMPDGSLMAMIRDITGRKELEAQLMRMQRMESVGRMAGGIAHDLNNILAPILMGAPLLRMGLPSAQGEKTLATIETSARRGADLVRQLLMFGRGIEGGRVPVRLRDLVREMEAMMKETFPKNIAITTEIPGNVWPVTGDITQLHQVLLNLCVNARDAMSAGGELTMTAKNIRIDESYASMRPEAKPGNYACLGVTDTGTGIPPEVVDKIFDPFFTTKEAGKGTGLGLSTLIGIVRSHAGFVTVRSEVGKGSTFEVFLPAEPGAEGPPVATDATLPPRGRGEMILLVDDEANIREIAGKTLEQHGYRVLTAGDGGDACVQFARHLGEVKMVLTDIDMPVMGGVAMIQVIKKMNPAVKIIVSSGKAADLAGKLKRTASDDSPIDSILAKPYTSDKALWAVHELLAPVGTERS